jgi:hypothetical protein
MTIHDLRFINLSKRDGHLFIRCPKQLKEAISASADQSARSIAAEVVIRLVASLKDHDFITGHLGGDYE